MSEIVKKDISKYIHDIEHYYDAAVNVFCALSRKNGLKQTFKNYAHRDKKPSRILRKLKQEMEKLLDDPISEVFASVEIESEPIQAQEQTPPIKSPQYIRHSVSKSSPEFIQSLFNEYKRIIKHRSHLHNFLYEESGKEEEEIFDIQMQIWTIAHRENEIWDAINLYKSKGEIKIQANSYYQQAIKDMKRLQSLNSLIAQARKRAKEADSSEKESIKAEIRSLLHERETLKNKINGQ